VLLVAVSCSFSVWCQFDFFSSASASSCTRLACSCLARSSAEILGASGRFRAAVWIYQVISIVLGVVIHQHQHQHRRLVLLVLFLARLLVEARSEAEALGLLVLPDGTLLRLTRPPPRPPPPPPAPRPPPPPFPARPLTPPAAPPAPLQPILCHCRCCCCLLGLRRCHDDSPRDWAVETSVSPSQWIQTCAHMAALSFAMG
jgi:hypothetical protein